MTSKKMCLSPNPWGPIKGTISGKGDFADVVKDLEPRPCGFRAGPRSHEVCPYARRNRGRHRETHQGEEHVKTPAETRGRCL